MPRLSEFFGIIIALYYNDHEPPHIHAIYGEYHVLIGIQPVGVIRGAFPPRALGLVIEWMTLHHSELAEDWRLAKEHGRLRESRLWSKGTRNMETVIKVNIIRPYILEVTFSDGVCKQIDLTQELYGEAFEPLRDPGMFLQVAVDEALGTIVWPNGADLSPEFLYNWRA